MTRTLKWMKVESTAIAGMAYDQQTHVLHVLFHHGECTAILMSQNIAIKS